MRPCLLVTFLLTIFVGLTEAIVVGFALGSILFIHRMAQTTEIAAHVPFAEEPDRADARERASAARTTNRWPPIPTSSIYRITGAFFFGAAAAVGAVLDRISTRHRALIVDLSAVPFLDATAANTLEGLARKAAKRRVRVVLTGANHEVRAGAARARRASRRSCATSARSTRRSKKLRKAGLTGGDGATRRREMREAGDHQSRSPASGVRGLGEGALEQHEHAAPRALGLRFVVDLRIGRAPAVRGGVHLDLGVQLRFRERIAQHVLRFGLALSSFSATANRYCAFICGTSKCGLSGFCVTRPPPWNDAAAPTRSGDRGGRAHRDRAAHAVARRADLAALVDLRLLVEPAR